MRRLGLVLAIAACGATPRGAANRTSAASAQDEPLPDDAGVTAPPDASPAVLARAATIEAVLDLRLVGQGARLYHRQHGRFPDAAGPSPAPGSCCDYPDAYCPVDAATFDEPTWHALGVEPTEPYRYSLAFEPTADGFVARALGDRDCDGTLATFTLTGTVEGDDVTLSEITADDELE